IFGPFLNALRLIRAAVETRENGSFVVGINDIRVARIGNDVAAFAASNSVPVAAINETAIAARLDADRRVVLLRAINAIEKIVVGGHVIKLRGALIVLRGPILAAVDGNRRAAIIAVDEPIGILRINPERMMVAVRGVEAFKSFSSVNRAI